MQTIITFIVRVLRIIALYIKRAYRACCKQLGVAYDWAKPKAIAAKDNVVALFTKQDAAAVVYEA